MKIGNQTSYVCKDIFKPFEYAINNKFDAFEFFPDKNIKLEFLEKHSKYIKSSAKQHGITLSVHASLDIDIFEPEHAQKLIRQINFARGIDAGLVNIHYSNGNGTENFINALVPFIEMTKDYGIMLAIENTAGDTPKYFNQLFSELNKLNIERSHVGMCFDMGHANISPATPNNYIAFIDDLDQTFPIYHVHIHENYGDKDSHLPLFTGPSKYNQSGITGFIKRLKLRNFNQCMIMEQWCQEVHLLTEARNRLSNIILNKKIYKHFSF